MRHLESFIPLILLITIVVFVYRRSKRKILATGAKSVSGWLALLTVSLVALRPLFIFSGWSQLNYQEWKHDPIANLVGWESYKMSMALLALLAVGLSIYGGIGLWKGRSWGMVKRAIVVLWFTGPAHVLLQEAIIYAIFSGQAENKEFAKNLVETVVVAGGWTAYLLRSSQVSNIYQHATLSQVDSEG